MPPYPWFDVVIILALVALNGLFAMSELAIVSARRARLEAMVRSGARSGGNPGARAAIALAADPGKFLSTVQIGITLIAILSGAYSGEALGGPTGLRIEALGVDPETARTLGFAIVIGLTTFVSLIVGELVPKQIALRKPEPIAVIAALPMTWLARATKPIVWVLDGTSALIFRLLRLDRDSKEHLTAEELHLVVEEASRSGVIEEHERSIISGVVRLADRPVREVMTPRTEVEWINLDHAPVSFAEAMPHSRMPVGRGSIDALVGVVQARDLLPCFAGEGRAVDLEALIRKVPVVVDAVDAMDALQTLRLADVPVAFVHDEYGHFEGIVTPADLLAAIAGEFASDADPADSPNVVERDDGSLLVNGTMPADALAARLEIELPEDRDYATVAGFALDILKHFPAEGESFVEQGWRFEVIDLDGRRIDKFLVSAA